MSNDTCEIVEPMESGDERPPTPYTPPLPPVKKDDIPEPFENGEVKPLPVKDEKKVLLTDSEAPKDETDIDQKNPQTLYKKKKIPHNMR
jgi:hypothetical protein